MKNTITWLHISDLHIHASGDTYRRDIVFDALIKQVKKNRRHHKLAPDVIFVTGDIARSGKAAEYAFASGVLNDLCEAAGLKRERLFLVPGNHDVDFASLPKKRTFGDGTAFEQLSKLGSRKSEFKKLGAFTDWYNDYFAGTREFVTNSTCSMPEIIHVNGFNLGVLHVNTALFCHKLDSDHEKLAVGESCIYAALQSVRAASPDLTITLLHHPLEWLNPMERRRVRARLHEASDLILSGHLHEIDVTIIRSISGTVIQLSAGATYQTGEGVEVNSAMYGIFDGKSIIVKPICYNDMNEPSWRDLADLFPGSQRQRKIRLPRTWRNRLKTASGSRRAGVSSPVRTNLPPQLGNIFSGRENELREMQDYFCNECESRVLALHGPPGIGKTELAIQYAQTCRDRYPAGRFIVRADRGRGLLDLAEIGARFLGLKPKGGMVPLEQGRETLRKLGPGLVLLIFDDVESSEVFEALRPPPRVLCHALITSRSDHWPVEVRSLPLSPLAENDARDLIRQVAGLEFDQQHGADLVQRTGGIPAQLHQLAVMGSTRRSKDLGSVFSDAFFALTADAQVLLHATTSLHTDRIPFTELRSHMRQGARWTDVQFDDAVETCKAASLLDGFLELRIHPLVFEFMQGREIETSIAEPLRSVRRVQWDRLCDLAVKVATNPGDREHSTLLTCFALSPADWPDRPALTTGKHERILGSALIETGQFAQAQAWFESVQAIDPHGHLVDPTIPAASWSCLHQLGVCRFRQGDYDGAVTRFHHAAELERGKKSGRDDGKLGESLHLAGWCLSHLEQYEDAIQCLREAVSCKRTPIPADPDSVGKSLNHMGYCLFKMAERDAAASRHDAAADKFGQAETWFHDAVSAKIQGNVRGQIDYDSLGGSLHMLGRCAALRGDHGSAILSYARAIEAKNKGDFYGRINHNSIGGSLRRNGHSKEALGDRWEAETSYTDALAQIKLGDRYGRIDKEHMLRTIEDLARVRRELRGGGEVPKTGFG